jgi:hypothetical protein
MEAKILRTLATLGVPGVALGVFYLLLRQFGFQFTTIGPVASAAIAILFLLLVAGVTLYALRHFGTTVGSARPVTDSGLQADGTTGDGRAVGQLDIDDVVITKRSKRIDLDVRVRNSGARTVNITRANLQILSRLPAAAVYVPSAKYDLLVEGTDNVIPVAHALPPDTVDRFIIRVGFSAFNSSCAFQARLLLTYDGERVVISKAFGFFSG